MIQDLQPYARLELDWGEVMCFRGRLGLVDCRFPQSCHLDLENDLI
jgi:hypothetical protein